MKRLLGSACALLLFASSAATADDSSAALGAGGIVFTQSADIRMAQEDLSISPKAVRIGFVFANESGKDIDTTVGFPLPDIDSGEFWGSALGTVTSDPVNFVGFSVKADGKPVAVSVDQRAFLKGRDVTAIIKSVGLPVDLTIGKGNDLLVALPPAKRKILTAAGLAEFDKADQSDNAIPLWIVRTNYYWHQHFPAGKSVDYEQSYQPVTGQSFFSQSELDAKSEDSAFYLKSFCIDSGAKASLAKKIAASKSADPQNGGLLTAYTTDYILKTGNNWKGPIRRFHLTLDKISPDNVLSMCWKGSLKKTGPTTFEDTLENYAPDSDIKLLVVASKPMGG